MPSPFFRLQRTRFFAENSNVIGDTWEMNINYGSLFDASFDPQAHSASDGIEMAMHF